MITSVHRGLTVGLDGIEVWKSLVCGSNNLPRQNEGEKARISKGRAGVGFFSPLLQLRNGGIGRAITPGLH